MAMEGTRPFRKVAYCATETTQTSPLHKKSLRCVTMNSHPCGMCACHIWALSKTIIFFILLYRLHMIPRLVRPRHVRHQPRPQLRDGTLSDSKTTQELEPHPPIVSECHSTIHADQVYSVLPFCLCYIVKYKTAKHVSYLLQDHLKPMLQRRKSRPMAGRKNKEAREKAVQDHRAVRA